MVAHESTIISQGASGGAPAVPGVASGSKLLDECRVLLARFGLGLSPNPSDLKGSMSQGGATWSESSTSLDKDRRLTDQGAVQTQQHQPLVNSHPPTPEAVPPAESDYAPGRTQQAGVPKRGSASTLQIHANKSLGGDSSSSGSVGTWGTPGSSCRPSIAGNEDSLAAEAVAQAPRFGSRSLGGTFSGSACATTPPRPAQQRRPAGVPKLNLAQLPADSDSGSPPAAPAAKDAAGSKQRGSSMALWWQASGSAAPAAAEESEADLQAEIHSYLAPPKWMPTSEGRWYVHRPITSKEVQHYEALVLAMPAELRGPVKELLHQMLQAQYGAELMAARGVRVAKDITSEWSRLTGGLLDRIEGYEMNMARMKKQMHELQSSSAAAAATAATAAAAASLSSGSRYGKPSRRCTMGGALAAPLAGRPQESSRESSWDELCRQCSVLTSENQEMRSNMDSLHVKLQQAVAHNARLHLEAQEQSSWQAMQLQHEKEVQRQLSAKVREQQRSLDEHQGAAREREQQLLREVRALRASLLASQQVDQPALDVHKVDQLESGDAAAEVAVSPASGLGKIVLKVRANH